MSLVDTVSKIDRLNGEERECLEVWNEAADVPEQRAESCRGMTVS